jgi:colanic acid/amylovoran biosynthesis glycosyltransferase
MPPLAYYFSAFPAWSETFVRSQVRATEALGLQFLLVANRRPRAGELFPGDLPSMERTHYLTPVRPWAYFKANARLLTNSQGRYPQAWQEAWRLASHSPGQLATNLTHLAGAAYLKRVLESRQVRHVHVHYAFGAAAVALFLDRLSDIPYSLSIHGSDVLLENPLLEAKLARARFVVSNCRYHIDYLRQRFPSLAGRRFFLVRGGVDLVSSLWSWTRPKNPHPSLRLLHVARLAPVKGQDILLKACAHLTEMGVNWECRVVGEGPKRPHLEHLIRALGLEGRVSLLGACPPEEVARLYDWAQVVVLSSRSEGTPMTVIEAMAKARPVVAPRLSALPEMVLEGETGWLFRPGDPLDLAARLKTFSPNPQLIEAMGRAGRQRAEEFYNLVPNAKTFVNILAQEVPALGRRPETAVPHV